MSTPANLLTLEQVGVRITATGRELVSDCSLSVATGEALGLVGESGSGKSLSVRAVAGLIPPGLESSGRIRVDGIDLSELPVAELRALRARRLGMIFQTPRAYLNPLRTIGDFMTEALISVDGRKPEAARKVALELLDEVGVDKPTQRLEQRPGQLSGGLLQRVMIAAALAMEPQLLLADEITTALDVTTQEEVMALLADLRRDRHLALLFITHDIELARAVCDRIAVMKDGRTIETHPAATIAAAATNDYTRALLQATSGLSDISQPTVEVRKPPLLAVREVTKEFALRGGGRGTLKAVAGVSFDLQRGQSLGIVGESGSGKSTTARIICGLESATSGEIRLDGNPWAKPPSSAAGRRERAAVVQMVFQDPYQSLDPRRTVRQTITEAVRLRHRNLLRSDSDAMVSELMHSVGLSDELAEARPRSLSGGQRQRTAIARALAAAPEILVLDEALSALDVSAQLEMLKLLDRIRHKTQVALLMISHDLNVVRRLCDHVVVMRQGAIEEQGPIAEVLENPQQEYTRMLLDSIPRQGWTPKRRRSA